jgi:hypothetical protein
MWGNYEVASLVSWLNAYNQNKPTENKVGFFGLDVYCLWESMAELMPYIKEAEPSVVKAAQKVHACFQPFSTDAQEYAMAVAPLLIAGLKLTVCGKHCKNPPILKGIKRKQILWLSKMHWLPSMVNDITVPW